jgi:hypothetical protein
VLRNRNVPYPYTEMNDDIELANKIAKDLEDKSLWELIPRHPRLTGGLYLKRKNSEFIVHGLWGDTSKYVTVYKNPTGDGDRIQMSPEAKEIIWNAGIETHKTIVAEIEAEKLDNANVSYP